MIIESNSNHIVKELRKLKEKKYREKERCFILEGVASLKDMPSYVKTRYFIVAESKQGKYEDIVKNGKCLILSDKLYRDISDTVTSAGLAAVIEYTDLDMVSPQGDSLILDKISDPGNLGTLIRTAVAMNITDIYLADCCDLYSPKVLRATMGGVFRANFYRGDIQAVLACHKDSSIYALDMGGKDLFDMKFYGKTAIIVGSEAHGISRESLDRADGIIGLPTENGMESLNASVAGGIALYFLRRKYRR